MVRMLNRVRMTTTTTGTGTITLGSAMTRFATFAEAGAVNAATYLYVIDDGNDFETGYGTYTSAGTTFSRDTVLLSKIGGTAGTSKINLSGNATIAVTFLAEASTYVSLGATVLAQQTETATTSGTSIDYTNIPSWVKRITMTFEGVSTSGTSVPIIQLGDAGGVETTGYLGASTTTNAATLSTANYTTGFGIGGGHAASVVLHGAVILTLQDASNTWVASGALGRSDGTSAVFTGGSKATSATLDRVRLTTVGGADTFDAGAINITWE